MLDTSKLNSLRLLFSLVRRCQALSMLRYHKGQHVICLTDGVLDQYQKTKKKSRRRIEPKALDWKPPSFSRADLRFGY